MIVKFCPRCYTIASEDFQDSATHCEHCASELVFMNQFNAKQIADYAEHTRNTYNGFNLNDSKNPDDDIVKTLVDSKYPISLFVTEVQNISSLREMVLPEGMKWAELKGLDDKSNDKAIATKNPTIEISKKNLGKQGSLVGPIIAVSITALLFIFCAFATTLEIIKNGFNIFDFIDSLETDGTAFMFLVGCIVYLVWRIIDRKKALWIEIMPTALIIRQGTSFASSKVSSVPRTPDLELKIRYSTSLQGLTIANGTTNVLLNDEYTEEGIRKINSVISTLSLNDAM